MPRQPARDPHVRPLLSPLRVWIDTDVGDNPDDAVTLLLAAVHPQMEMAGVSTVAGDVGARARFASGLLGRSVDVVPGGPDVVPAVVGAQPDALLAIGPLTNVAALPDAGALPERVVVMGGALAPVRHRGALRDVETNFGADPDAAGQVVGRHPGVTLVPLDVTHRMVLGDDEVATLLDAWSVLGDAAPGWADPWVLHDPLALLVALDDVAIDVEERRLGVAPDGRLVDDPAAVETSVVVDADVAAATARIVDLTAGT